MFSWIGFALQLLKLVNSIMSYYERQGLIDQGYDQAIADQTKLLLVKTSEGKKIMEKVNAMPIEDVDAGLVALEPK